MKYFMENEFYTISQVIDELEQLGSYHMPCPVQYDNVEKPYYNLLWAMQLRYQSAELTILKTNNLPPMKIYEYCRECQTIRINKR